MKIKHTSFPNIKRNPSLYKTSYCAKSKRMLPTNKSLMLLYK